ncbi:hypothetical protein EXN66_Car022555 [Channa argus]|nr:hypothetical protein EXN66_Car022555 [Channa argus]
MFPPFLVHYPVPLPPSEPQTSLLFLPSPPLFHFLPAAPTSGCSSAWITSNSGTVRVVEGGGESTAPSCLYANWPYFD